MGKTHIKETGVRAREAADTSNRADAAKTRETLGDNRDLSQDSAAAVAKAVVNAAPARPAELAPPAGLRVRGPDVAALAEKSAESLALGKVAERWPNARIVLDEQSLLAPLFGAELAAFRERLAAEFGAVELVNGTEGLRADPRAVTFFVSDLSSPRWRASGTAELFSKLGEGGPVVFTPIAARNERLWDTGIQWSDVGMPVDLGKLTDMAKPNETETVWSWWRDGAHYPAGAMREIAMVELREPTDLAEWAAWMTGDKELTRGFRPWLSTRPEVVDDSGRDLEFSLALARESMAQKSFEIAVGLAAVEAFDMRLVEEVAKLRGGGAWNVAELFGSGVVTADATGKISLSRGFRDLLRHSLPKAYGDQVRALAAGVAPTTTRS
jgi:hypothetical protein